ncbi:TetR family transcriptional regulator [Cohnella xylanilytica]|uniref:TetR/AcrR family transcriptional regulator n=1 Tax=Cohnella xylanilytica TaxID=557555 RepID=UPI001B1560D6|nr:TetR/AcrR family transcriptional regulator [Cohnella xylanilytica]GIO12069.1 TetR family transcriptional regulator [Cohnella xylanilytica]
MPEEIKAIQSRVERRDAAENRQRILVAAHKLFEQYGVDQVSMNQIAAEAQIGPGTLYRRYANKGELCLDLIKDSVVRFFEDIEQYLLQNQQEPADHRLKGILKIFMPFIEKKAQLLTGGKGSASAQRLPYQSQNPLYNKMHQIAVELFDEMAAADHPSPNSIFKADMLLIAISIDSYFYQRDVRGYSPDEILEHLCSTFI